MRPSSSTIRLLSPKKLLILFLIIPSNIDAQLTALEKEVAAEITAAEEKVNEAADMVFQKQNALREAQANLSTAVEKDRIAVRLLNSVDRGLTSVRNNADAATSHIDRQIQNYTVELEMLKRNNGSPSQINDVQRYIVAYENMKKGRLDRGGFPQRISELHRERYKLIDLRERYKNEVESARQRLIQAETNLELAENARNEAIASLSTLRKEAPKKLQEIRPPHVQEVKVNYGSATKYSATWGSESDLVQAKIDALLKNIESQKEHIELRTERINDLLPEVERLNNIAAEEMDDYEWAVWGNAFAQMGWEAFDAAYNIVDDWKTLGPYSLFVEAGFRTWGLVSWATGDERKHKNWDVLNLPGISNDSPPTHSLQERFRYGDHAQWRDEIVKETAKSAGFPVENFLDPGQWKKRIKEVLTMALVDPTAVDPGGLVGDPREFAGGIQYRGPDYLSPLKAAREGKLWYSVEHLVLDGETWAIEQSPVMRAEYGMNDVTKTLRTNTREYLRMLRQNPTDFLSQMANKTFKNADWWKGMGSNIAQNVSVMVAQKATDYGIRETAWQEYLAADMHRKMAHSLLKYEGYLRDVAKSALEGMNQALLDLYDEKENAKKRRYLITHEDEVLEGKKEFQLNIIFSRPVEVRTVTVGGKKVEGTINENSWTGFFDLVELPELAQIEIDAIEPLSNKLIDDPVTIPEYVSETSTWNYYEPTPDTENYRVKLIPIKEGKSVVFLIDDSESMDRNNRLNEAKRAVISVISSDMISPDDEIAILSFSGCYGAGVNLHFTADKETAIGTVESLVPYGNTPLASAISQAAEYIASDSRRSGHALFVVTDGLESCKGNYPASVADAKTILDAHNMKLKRLQ
ncbi:vWA domain-containing protein [Cyclobacterium jeungdonense]|uniref:VWA domain-containing protein n=1 Tax=Cyclobacterium jeungdonense TaxID=708087 RepID=A0ABT8CCQ2_9BACT|nr:vWA domain-containing protein [Cyclobacterium jeungdonense]MDN3689461.1 VWA domain-containing protein [Cyclobacterium jeungdonense]